MCCVSSSGFFRDESDVLPIAAGDMDVWYFVFAVSGISGTYMVNQKVADSVAQVAS